MTIPVSMECGMESQYSLVGWGHFQLKKAVTKHTLNNTKVLSFA